MRDKNVSISTFISKILRHSPKEFGVEIDSEGFCEINQLVSAIIEHFIHPVTESKILSILETSEKDGMKRFQIVGSKVRATYNRTYIKER